MIKNIFIVIFFSFLFANPIFAQQSSNSFSFPREASIDHSKEFWIKSKIVDDEFLIKVFLPESYFDSEKTNYPVIYLTDGDRLFGLASSFVYYELYDEDIDVILVGIGYGSMELNGEKRTRDYRPSSTINGNSGSEKYLNFLKDELFEKVETEFRIDPSNRTLVGWSLGAAFTLDAMFKQPELFKNYIVLSARLNYSGATATEVENDYYSKRKDLPAKLYFSFGDEDQRFSLFPGFVQTINRREYENFKFRHDIFPGKVHDVLAISEGLGKGLGYIFSKENIDRVLSKIINEEGIEQAIKEYYRIKNSDQNGYNFEENRLNILGYGLLGKQKIKEAIEIFKLNVKAFPNSFNVYDSLGEAYMIFGNKEFAVKNYKKSLELNPQNTNATEMIKKISQK